MVKSKLHHPGHIAANQRRIVPIGERRMVALSVPVRQRMGKPADLLAFKDAAPWSALALDPPSGWQPRADTCDECHPDREMWTILWHTTPSRGTTTLRPV